MAFDKYKPRGLFWEFYGIFTSIPTEFSSYTYMAAISLSLTTAAVMSCENDPNFNPPAMA